MKTAIQIVVNWVRNLTDYIDGGLKKMGIAISKPLLAMICIIFGILVIVFPSLLVWIVGLFLMIEGIVLLTDFLETTPPSPSPPPPPPTTTNDSKT